MPSSADPVPLYRPQSVATAGLPQETIINGQRFYLTSRAEILCKKKMNLLKGTAASTVPAVVAPVPVPYLYSVIEDRPPDTVPPNPTATPERTQPDEDEGDVEEEIIEIIEETEEEDDDGSGNNRARRIGDEKTRAKQKIIPTKKKITATKRKKATDDGNKRVKEIDSNGRGEKKRIKRIVRKKATKNPENDVNVKPNKGYEKSKNVKRFT